MKLALRLELDTLAERVREHLAEADVLREGMAHEGPHLIQRLQDSEGWGCTSLRSIARRSGLSPAYLSMVVNGKQIISLGAYLRLIDLLNAEVAE